MVDLHSIINNLKSSTSPLPKQKTNSLSFKISFLKTIFYPQPIIIMHFSALALSAAIALPLASAYPVKTDGLHCRSGPGTSYSIVKTYAKGTELSISCQIPGTDVSGDSLWDKTSDGCYVTDYYVLTGTSNYVAQKCGSSSGGGGSSGGQGVDEAALELIGSLEGWSATYYYINGHKTIGKIIHHLI